MGYVSIKDIIKANREIMKKNHLKEFKKPGLKKVITLDDIISANNHMIGYN